MRSAECGMAGGHSCCACGFTGCHHSALRIPNSAVQLCAQLLQLLESPLNFFVAGHLAVVALALELDFELVHFVADFHFGCQAQAIDEEFSIEMVGFMLNDAGEQTL